MYPVKPDFSKIKALSISVSIVPLLPSLGKSGLDPEFPSLKDSKGIDKKYQQK